MNCETARKQFSLLLYGELSFDDEEILQQHLDACGVCRESLAAEKRMHEVVDSAEQPLPAGLLAECRMELRDQLRQTASPVAPLRKTGAWDRIRSIFAIPRFAWQPVGAVALVALGFFGARISGTAVSGARIASLSDPIASRVRYVEPDQSGRVQVVVEETRQRVLSGSLEDDRIQQLLLAAAVDKDDPGLRVESLELLKAVPASSEVRSALIHALRHDSNPGVRLKALEGLKEFAGESQTRKALAEALLSDDNPGVRTQAIDLLVQRKEQEVVGVLQQVLRKEDNGYIRQRSQKALREMNASVETF